MDGLSSAPFELPTAQNKPKRGRVAYFSSCLFAAADTTQAVYQKKNAARTPVKVLGNKKHGNSPDDVDEWLCLL